jgi:PAS domain-containing protein
MRSVCAWCGAELKAAAEGADPAIISHGICRPCADRFFRPRDRTMHGFLNQMGAPTVLVDDDVRVLEANDDALQMLGKTRHDVVGYFGGDVLECANAELPGGCGHTVHCLGCELRRSVTRTAATGVSVDHQLAFIRGRQPVNGTPRTDRAVTISTEKIGGLVLLRLDQAAPIPRVNI